MGFPKNFALTFERVDELRYGQNPQNEKAARYRITNVYTLDMFIDPTLMNAKQYQGKTMSFNNWLDADAALKMVREFDDAKSCCAVFKHTNPSGVAIREDPMEAYQLAWDSDPLSAFGSIIGVNFEVDTELAKEMIKDKFVEVTIAPSYTKGATDEFKKKKNLRVLEVDVTKPKYVELNFKFITGGVLVEEVDRIKLTKDMLTYPNDLIPELEFEIKRPTDEQIRDMLLGWRVVRNVFSNSIVIAKEERTIGIGAGQQNRIDSAFIAGLRANKPYKPQKQTDEDKKKEQADELYKLAKIAGLRAKGRSQGSVIISDAFYPFRDVMDLGALLGIEASLSPNGSKNDTKSYQAMHEHGIAAAHTDVIPEDKEGYRGGRRGFNH